MDPTNFPAHEPPGPGIVYLFVNAAMPGFVKIGMTQSDDLATRIRSLNGDALPVPFELHYAAKVPDCRKVMETLYFAFGEQRALLERGFFKIDPMSAQAVIALVADEQVFLTKDAMGVTPDVEQEISRLRNTTDNFSFEVVALRAGDVLTFYKDPGIIAIVIAGDRVSFDGQEFTLAKAAALAFLKMGYECPHVRATNCWLYRGEKLSSLNLESADVEPDEDGRTSNGDL